MTRPTSSSPTDRLTAWLDKATQRRGGLPQPQVLVRAPGLDVEYGDLSTPFHAASVGKLATAALVAGLIDQRRFSFDTPIGSLLPPAELAGLPAAPGVELARNVTVGHLLTHTSGLPDYFEPPGRARTACSVTEVVTDLNRRWTPKDLLDEIHPLPATASPGQRFAYSDTGYLVLGRIVEEALGQSFAETVRTRIFEPAGMTRSSTPYDATLIADDLTDLDVAPLWLGQHELSRTHCLSVDWAGGGIVATAGDLLRFQRALHAGELVTLETLARLIRVRHRFRRGIHYGAGCMTLRFAGFFPLLRGLPQPVGHLGVTATHLFYYPEQDAHVVLNFHSTEEMRRSFDAHILIARLLSARAKLA